MYKIYFTKKSQKELTRLALSDSQRLLKKLSMLAIPFPKNLDVKKMVNTPYFYRLRSATVRVIFEVDTKQQAIWIRKIGYRGNVYS